MTIAFIQARQNSKRFKNKIFSKLDNAYIIDWVCHRLTKSKKIKKFYVLIPNNKENLKLKLYLKKKNINYILGPENNVLRRFFIGLQTTKADQIVRICGDNPFICWKSIDNLIDFFKKNKCDYAYNHIPYKNNFPDGIGAEIVSAKILEKIYLNAKKTNHKEHVFNYIWDNINDFNVKTYFHRNNKLNYPKIKLDIDYVDDLKKYKTIKPKINDAAERIILKYKKMYNKI